ncbi:SRPBCC family protein [Marivirga sp.]|uniref:SRPBCC family protein n=1 Tax=Marivirga sp. TaxID=2018662 RepID=UPI002D80927E|nr:SRPBCC family protein [Marivirga sp.]HET8861208.1 SRPBCC family protein [Marivirga sp.]
MTSIWITLTLIFSLTGIAFAQKAKNYRHVKVNITIDATVESAFNYIVPVDLSHIFKGYKNLPAIVNTDEKEKWIKPGLTRTVYFEDGTTAREKLLTVVPHTSFSYESDNFTSKLRFLAKRIEGDWVFTDLGNGKTKIEWNYKIVP